MSESCLGKKASTVKTADGAVLYLVEEIGDARVRLAQLKNYVKEGLDLVEKSDQKDHFFEMAGHLLLGIPDTIFKLEKALGAAAMAAARLDYEEVKQTLKPEKAEELENVLPDVRLRQPRRSEENSMTPKQAAEHLLAIADETETTGIVPVQEVMTLLATLEAGQTKKASTPTSLAHSFRAFAKSLQSEPNRLALASRLRHVLADVTADARDMKINPRIDIQRFYQNCVRDAKTPSEAVKQLLASGADRSAVKAFVGY